MTNKQSENSFFGEMFSDFAGSKVSQPKGTFVGTRDYISPEMANDSISGPFSDIWALGIITFELYTSKRPWISQNEAGIYDEIISSKLNFDLRIPLDA